MTGLRNVLCAVALVVSAGWVLCGCSSGGTTSTTDPDAATNAKYIGTWRLPNVKDPSLGYDVVFKEDNVFAGSDMGKSGVRFFGSYSVDASGKCTGTWMSTSSTAVGQIEANFESDTVMYFKLLQTNAYDNPDAVNGYIFTEHRGSKI
jgi:hypothetical protein